MWKEKEFMDRVTTGNNGKRFKSQSNTAQVKGNQNDHKAHSFELTEEEQQAILRSYDLD